MFTIIFIIKFFSFAKSVRAIRKRKFEEKKEIGKITAVTVPRAFPRWEPSASKCILHARVINRLLNESRAHVVGVLGEGKIVSFGGGAGEASGEGRLGAAYDGTAHTARVIKIISVYLARRDIPDNRYRHSRPSCAPSSPPCPSVPSRTP